MSVKELNFISISDDLYPGFKLYFVFPFAIWIAPPRSGWTEWAPNEITEAACENGYRYQRRYCKQPIRDLFGRLSCAKNPEDHQRMGIIFSYPTVKVGPIGEQTRKENCNECNTDNGGCKKHCKDTQGSFKCYCDDGYRSQGKKCESMCVVIDMFV